MSDESESRNWLELPRELTVAILSRLGPVDILTSVQSVCSLWRRICKDPSMWRSIDFHDLGKWPSYDLEDMCMKAIDRSEGNLVDINIEHFATDYLLAYITDRSSHIRCLRLLSCHDVSDKGLCKAAKSLALLEELDISYCSFSPTALIVVGRHCPHLKSFKYNKQDRDPYGFTNMGSHRDKAAKAIAENMHELRHLQLFGNKLTNCGLEAILDGCPHLESLDLRHCFNVSLQGDLEKRCAEQIKHLRQPKDSTQDYKLYQVYHKSGLYDEDDLSEFSYSDSFSDGDYDYELEYLDSDYPYELYNYDDSSDDYYDQF